MVILYCGAIIERDDNGEKEILMQTRWKPHADLVYSGTLEFPAGVLDKPFENVHDTLAREIKEEAGLTLKAIKQDQRTSTLSTGKDDQIIGFRPYSAKAEHPFPVRQCGLGCKITVYLPYYDIFGKISTSSFASR